MTATPDLASVAEAVRSASGIYLRPHQYDSLNAAVTRAVGGLDHLDGNTALAPGSVALELVVDEVAVKETTFLRDRQQLEAIDWHDLLQRVPPGEVIRVWSAGCATGEEVYSLAILACEAFGSHEPPVRIIGTDLSQTALRKARMGCYRERAMREVDGDLRDRYFSLDGPNYMVNDRIRGMVHFVRHNMVTEPTPPPDVTPCSLVVCRNVFIYFEPTTVSTVLAGFARALTSEGVIIVGAADALVVESKEKGSESKPGTLRGTALRTGRSTTRTERRARLQAVRTPEAIRAGSSDRNVAAAVVAASQGRRQEALEHADAALAHDPMNAHALLVRGLIAVMSGQPSLAVPALRAALYADPTLGLAAFMLGRAHDACGDTVQARRAYEQSLRTLESGDRRHDQLLGQIELGDVAAACRARLAATA